MLHVLNSLLAPAVMERVTLVVNHVLAGEAAATARLEVHAGRLLQVELGGWPALLPPPPALAFRVTPAGLVEWAGADAGAGAFEADLHVRVDASNPVLLMVRMLGGSQPPVEIHGNAMLATDVHWLLDNVRWDVAADADRLFGPVVGPQLTHLGSALARALRAALRRGGDLAARLRPLGAGHGAT